MELEVYLVGIAGGSGSGKTTFAKKIQTSTKCPVHIIHMDSYYLNKIDVKTASGQSNYDHPEAFDWELLTKHLMALKNSENIEVPCYDFVTNSRLKETEMVSPTQVIILEGIFSLYQEQIRSLFDLKCFLHVDADIRFMRRLHRDVKERGRTIESIMGQYIETVRPMHLKYLEPQKYHADFIVGEETDTAAHVVAAKISQEASSESFLQ